MVLNSQDKTLKGMMAPFRTLYGRYVDLANPQAKDISIEDIAGHLSKVNRFNGATKKGYSVGQHSIFMAQWFLSASQAGSEGYLEAVDCLKGTAFGEHLKLVANNPDQLLAGRKQIAFELLVHDGSEAYLGDVTSHLKQLLPEYKRLEQLWTAAIRQRFCMSVDQHPLVKRIDVLALEVERHLFQHPDDDDVDAAHLWPMMTSGEKALAEILVQRHRNEPERSFILDVSDAAATESRFRDLYFSLNSIAGVQ